MPQTLHRVSVRLIPTLAGSGLVIFAITGLLGYCSGGRQTCPATLDFSSPPAFVDSVFLKPWILFLWLCALIFTVQAATLAEEQRRWRYWTYVVTAICIVLVGVFEFYGREIISWLETILQQVLGQRGLFFRLVSSSWLYTIVNFGIIVLLGAGTVRRGIRLHRERAKVSGQRQAGGQEANGVRGAQDLPEMHELIIGDVLVRSVIVLFLSFGIRAEILGLIIPRPDPSQHLPTFDACSVALPGRCAPTLSFLDLILALLGLVCGVALAATFTQDVAGQRAQQPHDGAPTESPAPQGIPSTPLDQGSSDVLQTSGKTSSPTLKRMGPAVADALLDILVRPFQPIGAASNGQWSPYDPLAVARVVAWPSLILIGTFSVGILARATQRVLHHTMDIAGIPQITGLPWISTFPSDRFLYELLAVGAGIVAVVGIVLSAGVITNSQRVTTRGFDFVRRNGFITLVLFGSYALALWLLQVLLVQFFPPPQDQPTPVRLTAFNPGFLTYLSFALLLWFGVPRLIHRFTKR
jgi:hypothetical protein